MGVTVALMVHTTWHMFVAREVLVAAVVSLSKSLPLWQHSIGLVQVFPEKATDG